MLDQIVGTAAVGGVFMLIFFIPSFFIGKEENDVAKVSLNKSCYIPSTSRHERIVHLQNSINEIMNTDADLIPHRREAELVK